MRKLNPKIRWHLTAAECEQIAALRSQGLSQTAIAMRLAISRNTVRRVLRKSGLPTLVPMRYREKDVLDLLRQGIERRTIGRMLKVPHRAITRYARENGFTRLTRPKPNPRISAQRLAELENDIVNHRATAAGLYRKYRNDGVGYRWILRMAHEILACERFLSSNRDPFVSYYPQRHRKVQ